MSQEMAHVSVFSIRHDPYLTYLQERDAVLSQIQRAIYTSPTPLPDITFTISALDTPRDHIWSFARSSTSNDKGEGWVMPHFSFWSWPKSFIGTIDQALANIERVEREFPWDKKIAKAVWRGSVHFNSELNLDLRPKMLQATRGKTWADVEEMRWENNGMNANNSIPIHDFCRYKYILYTEVRYWMILTFVADTDLCRERHILAVCRSIKPAKASFSHHLPTSSSTTPILCDRSSPHP